TIKASEGTNGEWSQEELLEHLFAVLSHNTFPMPESGEDWGYQEQLEALRHSVFIPPFETATSGDSKPSSPPVEESEQQVEEGQEGEEKHRLSALPHHVQPTSSNVSTRGSVVSTPTLAHSNPSEKHSGSGMPTSEKPINQAMPGTEKSTLYGTQKQTIILVDHNGHVTYVERTLFDDDAKPLANGEADVREEFDIEGW